MVSSKAGAESAAAAALRTSPDRGLRAALSVFIAVAGLLLFAAPWADVHAESGAVIALPVGGTPLYVAAMTTSMRFGSPLAIPASMLGAMSPACVTRWAATPIEAASET
jgi:hypothetical protein